MSSFDGTSGEADSAFERALLHSASDDAPSARETRAAWERLALSIAATAATAGGGVALGVAGAGAKHGAAWAAARWAAIGATVGSSLTALLMAAHFAAMPAPAPRVVVPTAVPAPLPVASAEVPAPVVSTVPAPSAVPALRHPAVRAARSTHPAPRASDVTRTSTLAAEVALLDAARTAIATGADDDALRIVGEYRRTFPRGELAADAEVVAIDALAAKDLARAAADAQRFLSQHPNDPHAAHVRAVVDGK